MIREGEALFIPRITFIPKDPLRSGLWITMDNIMSSHQGWVHPRMHLFLLLELKLNFVCSKFRDYLKLDLDKYRLDITLEIELILFFMSDVKLWQINVQNQLDINKFLFSIICGVGYAELHDSSALILYFSLSSLLYTVVQWFPTLRADCPHPVSLFAWFPRHDCYSCQCERCVTPRLVNTEHRR